MKIPYDVEEKEIDVLGSRFIAICMPIESFGEIDSCLKQIEEKYPKATHYPYASRFSPYEKANDDGEPSHSTGMPLLSLLQQKDVDHVLLCVVRYFGGTKLGLSRLTRTYRETAALLLNEQTFAIEEEQTVLNLELSYSDFEYLKRLIKNNEIEIENVEYGISVTLNILGNDKIISSVLEKIPNADIKNKMTKIVRRKIVND